MRRWLLIAAMSASVGCSASVVSGATTGALAGPSTSTSTTLSATSSTAPNPTDSSTTTVVPNTVVPTTLPPATGQGWLVANDTGLWSVDAAGRSTRLVAGRVATVAVAADGTIFFQRHTLEDRSESIHAPDTRILTLDRSTGTTRDWLVPESRSDAFDGALHLEGVVVIAGRSEVLLRRAVFDPTREYEAQRFDMLVRRDVLADSETTLGGVAGWEFEATHISYGGNTFVASTVSEGSVGGLFLDASGARVNERFASLIALNDCTFGGPHCPTALAISTNGQRLAWIEAADDGHGPNSEQHQQLVVGDVASGKHLATIALAVGAAETTLAFAKDGRIVMTRVSYGDSPDAPRVATAFVVDVQRATLSPLPVAGHAIPDVTR